MKILFSAHWHLLSKIPVNRTDDIIEVQFNKVEQVFNIFQKEKCDMLLHGGDLFNYESPPYSIVERLLTLMNKYGIKITGIYGSHDLVGRNTGLRDTALSVLIESGYFNLLDYIALEREENDNVYIKGFVLDAWEDHSLIPNTFKSIAVTHSMLVTHFVPYHHTLLKDVKTNFDYILGSDSHAPYDVTIGKTRFLNPGCLLRQKINEKDIKPHVFIIDTVTDEVKPIYLNYTPDVFIEKQENKDIKIVQDIKIEDVDIQTCMEKLMSDSRDEVKLECRKRLKESNGGN